MQPTPTRSPTLNFVTPGPTATTLPTISWPGTHGYFVPDHSPRTVCRSEWQPPQYSMAILTSLGPGSRRSMVKWVRGVVADRTENAQETDKKKTPRKKRHGSAC